MKHVVLGHNDQAVNQTLMQILNSTVWIKLHERCLQKLLNTNLLQQEMLVVLFVKVLQVDEK